jgi:demethylmenaquinone methyltransferase / 2-methoxy-6-polyprenyl-1,4-benzoquinol methylase
MSEKTHFGFKEVPLQDKVHKVGEVFRSVAGNYDRMNDAMSLGMHRLWKKIAIDLTHARPGQRVLDLAAGTGDLTRKLSQRVGSTGHVVCSDINPAMLAEGRKKLLDLGVFNNIEFIEINAETIPFEANTFDLITMGFGLRNVTDKDKALREMVRVLKPGGQAIILEFSKPAYGWLETLYDKYSFNIIPKLGEWIASDKDSYQYLVESIRMHPDQETLKTMMQNAGFDQVDYFNLTGGIVAIHRGTKW